MEQHPVPQHIASYEFRLIGDMTLKQFGQLAVGAILGLIVYALPLIGIIKWPLIVFFGFLGFAFAFLPINERPLSLWLVAFFKAAFAPTQFIWQKKPFKPEVFEPLAFKPTVVKEGKFTADKQTLNQYLASLPGAKSPLDQQEESFLKEVGNLFQLAHPQEVKVPPGEFPPKRPQPIPSWRPKPSFQPVSPPPGSFKGKYPSQSFVPGPQRPVVLPQRPGRPRKPTVEAKINPKLLIPNPPSRPNIIVGMILDQEGKIVEGAILEIRNAQGLPVRALKTNKLGQFMFVTPLQNGLYEIETEKEGYHFDIIKIEVKGEIIQPVEIRAKGAN
ncbi:hypothetical protein FJZ41_03310 [Candidatus Shapirobacteria bacterium]|nr:hypothetical protein [Candidatus Shapirobacteria bacterium]